MGRAIIVTVLLIVLSGTATAQQRTLPPLPNPTQQRTLPPLPNPTSPTQNKPPSGQPQAPAQASQQQPTADQRGTENAPVVVKVLPASKSKEETEQDQAERQDTSSANWWMVRLTGAIGFIGLVQLIVFGIQARRLRQTISKMDEIATDQTADMQKMIAENTKTAAAMERVADGIAQQVTNATTTSSAPRNSS